MVAVVTALAVGLAVGGSAAWSWDTWRIMRQVQDNVCLNNEQIRLNSQGAHEPLVIPAQLPGCP